MGKQVGAIASVLVQVAALSSGMWFDLAMMGGAFRAVCYALPFAHAVDAARLALSGDLYAALPHMGWVTLYAAVIFILAAVLFRRRMKDA